MDDYKSITKSIGELQNEYLSHLLHLDLISAGLP